MKRILSVSLVVLVLLMALPITAFAGGQYDGRVVLGGNFVLESGEVLDGDLAIIGGQATLEEGSEVRGSVFLVGGNLVAYGAITRDVVVMGGNVNLGPSVVVGGDLVTFGGNVNRSGAVIGGDVIATDELTLLPLDWQRSFNLDGLPVVFGDYGRSFEGRVIGYLFQSFMLAALAVLALMFWPKQARVVSDTLIEQPVMAGALGLLTVIVAPILFLLLIITICLAVVGVAGVVVLVAAWVLGWIALGLEVGQRLSKASNQDWQPVLAGGLGTLILSLVANGIGFIPCVGWMAPFILGAIGMGAVIMTRFGTRRYGIEVSEVPPTDVEAVKPKRTRKKADSEK
ncbi:MAG: hypothetical protein E4G99_06445 [Anaerolineales bacterium]|nr:MAG: hypothetical protein E4G99_06445 [Anaerolineales bacterium]